MASLQLQIVELQGRIAELESALKQKTSAVESFHPQLRNQVLEEAAKVCDEIAWSNKNTWALGPEQHAVRCTAAIRALKTPDAMG